MRILIVAPEYPPYGQGGGGVVSHALVRKLAERGHRLTVISGYHERKMRINSLKRYDGKIKVIWIPLAEILEEAYPQLQGYLLPNLQSLTYLKTIDYDSFDVIHLFAFGHLHIDWVNLVSKSPRKILTIHGFPKYIEKDGPASLPLKLLYKIYFETLGRHTLNSASIITAVSTYVAKECIKRGLSKDRIRVIPNAIDLEKYRPTPYDNIVEEFQIKDDATLLLSMTRIAWQKGLEYALEAINKVIKVRKEPLQYMIAGPIEDRNFYSKLIRRIQKLGLKENVIFTGFLREKKLQALTRANIFLAPSLHESFGLAVLEAMALGKPIIASNCEGFRCTLEHMKTGILVKPGDSAEIANAILLMLSNPDLQKSLSRNALSSVKKYDWNDVVVKYERIYKQILDHKIRVN